MIRRKPILNLLLIMLAFGLMTPGALWAQDQENSGQGPISISADHMAMDDNRRIVTFTGRVIARQDDLIITCNQMQVHYQPRDSYENPTAHDSAALPQKEVPGTDGSLAQVPELSPNSNTPAAEKESNNPLSGGQEIDRVDCEGEVKIQQGERLAVGDKALYLAKAIPRRLVLTGNARVWQGQNAVTGHQVTYFLDQKRSQVDSQDKQRVRAFYETKGEKK